MCKPVSSSVASAAAAATSSRYPQSLPRRHIIVHFEDDALRARCAKNAQRLLAMSCNSDASSSGTSALLARKALKYRKVFDRMEGVDVTSPEFDASAFLGVQWRRS
ncbi:hypothetical protein PINS_up020795 [Pythium insidiosum]|nr:hypothetical protein PINS_up020795 [Pythium insidiosum]